MTVRTGPPQQPSHAERSGLAAAAIVWALLGIVGVEIFVTYTRTPIKELYHVRQGGPGEGLARALAFVGFPIGLVALATLALVVERVPRRGHLIGVLACGLVAAGILWPGAVDEAGLEVRPARLLAATGVALVLALTAVAVRLSGVGRLGRARGDAVRWVVAAVVLFGALPWIAADLGLSLDRIPLLNAIFQTDLLSRQPSRSGLHPSVHDGHHHGMDGVLLVLASLLLSRDLASIRRRALRTAAGIYFAFLFVYGLANAVQDFWLEQIVKRGWTTFEFPMMLIPSRNPAWAVILALAAAGGVLLSRLTASEAGRRGELT